MAERILAALLCAALMGGCTLAPSYQRPDAPVATEWPTGDAAGAGVAPAELGWRDFFGGDERLQALVALALENNRDLRVAALNVERVQAFYRIERAQLLPRVDAGASATFQELPAALPSSRFAPTEQYAVNLGVTAWELDFFGRIRSLSEQALQQWLASAEAQRSFQLALVAQLAVAHLDERAAAEQLELASDTLAAVEASHALTARSFEAGVASELDLRTAEAQVQGARFNLAFYQQRHGQAVNALTYLVGTQLPADLPPGRPLGELAFLGDLPPGLPSDLLQRRPDILAAEHRLLAANASIGAARAAFFPSITLTGSAGVASTSLGDLFDGGAGTWSFTPRINLPIFRAGALRASLDAAEIGKEISVAAYQRTIQAAFREVADALIARGSIEQRLEAQAARVAADRRRYELAETRYRAGVERYVTVLTAQRDLYNAQQTLVDTHFVRLANLATLYKALGGGWLETTSPPADG